MSTRTVKSELAQKTDRNFRSTVFQGGSGAYSLAAAQGIFGNRLLQALRDLGPDLDAAQVLGTGASDIHRTFKGDDLAAVLDAYMVGIHSVFIFSLAASGLLVIVALAIPFKRLPEHGNVAVDKVEASE